MQDPRDTVSTRFGEPLAAAGILDSPAAERNKGPILEVLVRVLPAQGAVLEVASGTGQHVVCFARALPDLHWRPSDVAPELLEAIRSRLAAAALPNVAPPLALDVLEPRWPDVAADAVLCINMIHIAPWRAARGLFAHAARLLASGAPLILYGPYKRSGTHTAPSNAAFDESLRARNPEWGVRDLDDVTALGAELGFRRDEVVAMPANNLTVVYRRD
jgi:SAM-dependent methyltransferase